MILTKEVEMIVSSGNINYLKKLGYTHIHRNEKITIPIEHLSKGSGKVVIVKCDLCGREKEITYAKYIINIKSTGIYCCSEKCGLFKHEKTCLEKYGQKNYSKTKDFHKKREKTCLKKYGAKNVFQSEIIKEKIKKNNLAKYGLKYASQAKEFREKVENTNLKKYGFKHSIQNEKIKNKKKKTNIERYGCENVFQNKNIKEKSKQTIIKKYGVENVSQNIEIHKKQQEGGLCIKKHKETGLYYRGTYEKHFLDFCFKNYIPVKKGKTIKYVFNNKTKIYFSDFYLEKNNLIIEIKSSYYFNKYKSKNIAKQNSCLKQGYGFIFIIDKNYEEFKHLIK